MSSKDTCAYTYHLFISHAPILRLHFGLHFRPPCRPPLRPPRGLHSRLHMQTTFQTTSADHMFRPHSGLHFRLHSDHISDHISGYISDSKTHRKICTYSGATPKTLAHTPLSHIGLRLQALAVLPARELPEPLSQDGQRDLRVQASFSEFFSM